MTMGYLYLMLFKMSLYLFFHYDEVRGCKPALNHQLETGVFVPSPSQTKEYSNVAEWLLTQDLLTEVLHNCRSDSHLAIKAHLSAKDQADLLLPRQ